MQTPKPLVRSLLTLGLMLLVACATSREVITASATPGAVKESVLPGGRVKLTFGLAAPNPALEVMELEEAQAVLTVFHAALLAERPQVRVIPPPQFRLLDEDEGWGEKHLRERFQRRFGGMLLPMPERVEQSRLYQTLKLSPRYMGEGVREAARELFSSPVFLASVCLSVAVYFGAWLAPEPFLSKAFAVTLTAALALTVGMMEVANVALACLRLYWESQAAKTEKELEAASARFGKAMGGTGLRVLVMVASMGLAKTTPTVPAGGLGALFGSPRYMVQGGLAVEATATAQVVADGSLVLSGVATGEVATRLCGGLAMCATMDSGAGAAGSGAQLSTRYGPPHTQQNPPHNEAIEKELAAREAAGHTDLRKNKAQLSASGQSVHTEKPVGGVRFRRPDVSTLRPDGIRHNTNYVSNARDLKRELEAFEAMLSADKKAIHELYLLDGTLVRRYVPPGVSYPQ